MNHMFSWFFKLSFLKKYQVVKSCIYLTGKALENHSGPEPSQSVQVTWDDHTGRLDVLYLLWFTDFLDSLTNKGGGGIAYSRYSGFK